MSDVEKLVPLSRELAFDDTMDEVNAVLRMDAKLENNHVKAQLLIDFRHKMDKRKSKPRFYGTMSQPRQFEDLVSISLAITCFHMLQNRVNPTTEEILACISDIVKWRREDIRHLVQILAQAVEIRRAKLLLGRLEK